MDMARVTILLSSNKTVYFSSQVKVSKRLKIEAMRICPVFILPIVVFTQHKQGQTHYLTANKTCVLRFVYFPGYLLCMYVVSAYTQLVLLAG